MNKRLGAIAVVVAAIAGAGGLFARPSHGAGQPGKCDPVFGCPVALTDTGPVPSSLEMGALQTARFSNTGSVSHTVVFANGLCSLTVAPGTGPTDGKACENSFMAFVGTYSYTVDGKFPGTVITAPLGRSVSLTARTHTIRDGKRLILNGQVTRGIAGTAPPPPVIVLARRVGTQPFELLATVRTKASPQGAYGWKFSVRPDVPTTYIARVTAQRLCYYPASRCAHPQGQVWANVRSRPFTVRIRH